MVHQTFRPEPGELPPHVVAVAKPEMLAKVRAARARRAQDPRGDYEIHEDWCHENPEKAARQRQLRHEADRAMLARYESKTAEAQREVKNAERRGRGRKLEDARRRLATFVEARDACAETVLQHDRANWGLDDDLEDDAER